jgi:hypothetical protein
LIEKASIAGGIGMQPRKLWQQPTDGSWKKPDLARNEGRCSPDYHLRQRGVDPRTARNRAVHSTSWYRSFSSPARTLGRHPKCAAMGRAAPAFETRAGLHGPAILTCEVTAVSNSVWQLLWKCFDGNASEMRRHDTYCSNFSCTPAALAVGLRPGARCSGPDGISPNGVARANTKLLAQLVSVLLRLGSRTHSTRE